MAKLNEVLENGWLRLTFYFLTPAASVLGLGIASPDVNLPVLITQSIIAGLAAIGALFTKVPDLRNDNDN
jgi:hypothetical protein